jgi:hypothetical protein
MTTILQSLRAGAVARDRRRPDTDSQQNDGYTVSRPVRWLFAEYRVLSAVIYTCIHRRRKLYTSAVCRAHTLRSKRTYN